MREARVRRIGQLAVSASGFPFARDSTHARHAKSAAPRAIDLAQAARTRGEVAGQPPQFIASHASPRQTLIHRARRIRPSTLDAAARVIHRGSR
jgi:hypothetical protein